MLVSAGLVELVTAYFHTTGRAPITAWFLQEQPAGCSGAHTLLTYVLPRCQPVSSAGICVESGV